MSKAKKVIRIGDRVKFYTRKYVKGSRCPSNPRGRFTYKFYCEGTLIARTDLRAHQSGITVGWTQEQVNEHWATHLAAKNAAGGVVGGDVTEGNNPILLDMPLYGEAVVWCYAEQIKSI